MWWGWIDAVAVRSEVRRELTKNMLFGAALDKSILWFSKQSEQCKISGSVSVRSLSFKLEVEQRELFWMSFPLAQVDKAWGPERLLRAIRAASAIEIRRFSCDEKVKKFTFMNFYFSIFQLDVFGQVDRCLFSPCLVQPNLSLACP